MSEKSGDDPPRAEWVLGILGILVALSIVGFLVVQALGRGDDVVELRAEVARVQEAQGGWAVVVTVENRGGRSAEAVVVRGELPTPDGPEEVEVEIDYVPGSSTRDVTLTFTEDPRRGELEVRPVSWRD